MQFFLLDTHFHLSDLQSQVIFLSFPATYPDTELNGKLQSVHLWPLQVGCCCYSHMAGSSSSASPVTISYLFSPSVPNVKGISHSAWPATEWDHTESHSNEQQTSIWQFFVVSASTAKVIYPNPIKVLSYELK